MIFNVISSISSFGVLIVSFIALVYAKKEYNNHKKMERTNLLCHYHQRYVSDPNIESVIRYILKTARLDNNGEIIGFDKNKITNDSPGIYEKERFMRFYEELDLQIKENNLDVKLIKKFFSYYLIVFDSIDEYHNDITDYHSENWESYQHIVDLISKTK